MKKVEIFVLLVTLITLLTGCYYNGYSEYNYFGENVDDATVRKSPYEGSVDYLLNDFDTKVVTERNTNILTSYDFVETSLTLTNHSATLEDVMIGEPSDDSNVKGQQVVDYAKQFVGNPYVYGGTSLTNGADCSGFTQSVYKHFGYTLPRTAAQQWKACKNGQSGFKIVKKENLKPGDLVFCKGSKGSANNPGHVAIYAGNDEIVHAASSTQGIIKNKLTRRDIIDYGRIIN